MKNIKKFKIDSFTYVFLLTSFLCGQIKNTIILFLIVIFHEFGHVFFALLFKTFEYSTRNITFARYL